MLVIELILVALAFGDLSRLFADFLDQPLVFLLFGLDHWGFKPVRAEEVLFHARLLVNLHQRSRFHL